MQSSKHHWSSFNSDGSKGVLVSGDASAGMNCNGFRMRARMVRASLKYAYPKEGMTVWMDNLVVFEGAPNLENAKKFLNFMMLPEHAGALSNCARYANGIKGAGEFMDADLKSAPELNPPPGANLEFVPPCSEKVVRLYDRIWTNLLK